MILIIFAFLVILQTMPLLYYMYAGAANPAQPQCLGVSMNSALRNNPEVMSLFAEYKSKLKKYYLLAGLFFLGLVGLLFVFKYVVLFVIIIFGSIFFSLYYSNQLIYQARRKLLEIKHLTVTPTDEERTVTADLRVSRLKNATSVKSYFFGIPILLSVGFYFLIHRTAMTLVLLITIIGIQLLCFGINQMIRHMPAKIISQNPEINLAYNQMYRNDWSKTYLFLSFIQSFLFILIGFLQLQFLESWANVIEEMTWVMLSLMLLMGLLPILFVIYRYHHLKRQEQEWAEIDLIPQYEDGFYVEDGIWGLQYCNPDNPAFIVNKAIGIGQTLNIGRPLGAKLHLGSKILAIVVLLSSFLVVSFEDFVAPQFMITPKRIVISQTLYPLEIPAENIESITIRKDNFHRKGLSKEVGSATDRYARGIFNTRETKMQLYIFHDQSGHAVIKVRNMSFGEIALNENSESKNQELFHSLQTAFPDIIQTLD